MRLKSRLTILTTLYVLSCCPALTAQDLNSRQASAYSYVERGNPWLAKGDLERAVADYHSQARFTDRGRADHPGREKTTRDPALSKPRN